MSRRDWVRLAWQCAECLWQFGFVMLVAGLIVGCAIWFVATRSR